MFLCAETMGQQLCQGDGFVASVLADDINEKIILAKFPHHLAADTAGRECAGDGAILAAADGDGHEVPVAIVNGLEKGGALGAVGGAVGGIFNVAALVHGAVGTEQAAPTLKPE